MLSPLAGSPKPLSWLLHLRLLPAHQTQASRLSHQFIRVDHLFSSAWLAVAVGLQALSYKMGIK